MREVTVLKACAEGDDDAGSRCGRIVGSVRGRRFGDACAVGRLIVHPDLQRQGIGSRLLLGIEACFPDVARFELFTGDRSEATIRLYERLGYRVFRREAQTTQVNLVFMEKCVGE